MAKQVVKMWDRIGSSSVTQYSSNNDEMAIGAIRSFGGKGSFWRMYMCLELMGPKTVYRNFKIGNLEATVFQDGVSQGKKSVEIVLNLLKNKKPELETFVKPELITIENYKKIRFE